MVTNKIPLLVLLTLLILLPLACSLGGNGSTPPADSGNGTPPTIYELGGTGPGGGLIFFDKGQYDNKMWYESATAIYTIEEHPSKTTGTFIWRYLEIAPKSTENTSCEWGSSVIYWEDLVEYPQNRETAIGGGIKNTSETVYYHDRMHELPIYSGNCIYYSHPEQFSLVNDGTVAARYCSQLGYNDLTDWFLPSEDTLQLIYMRLKVQGLNGQFYYSEFENAGYWGSTESGSFKSNVLYFTNSYNPEEGHQENHYVRAVRAF